MIDLKALAQKIRGFFGKAVPTGFEAFEFDTVGADAQPDTILRPNHEPYFVDGYWALARHFAINGGRLGGAISPWCTVVHTTDMAPGTMSPLLKRWRDIPGEGAGAHFLIGKSQDDENAAIPTGGIVQLAPITRNGNHAGGNPSHGWFKLPSGRLIHPNSVAVGIEIDNAGRLVKKGTAWIHKDSGKIIPTADVFVDAHGRGYEKLTSYQWAALELLLDTLDYVLPKPPAGVVVVPNGTYKDNGVPEASLPWCREVGHWTLDPNRKTDPGPEVDAWLEKRARR